MLKIALFFGFLISSLFLCTHILEKKVLFYPSYDIEITPNDVGLVYEDVSLTTDDGVLLHGWFIPAKDAYATVLYFHGNAGNISHRVEIAKMFYQRNMNFFIFDYRGFGKSQGNPHEKGTYLDGMAAYEYLVYNKQIDPKDIILYGTSLGVSVAVDVATRVTSGACIFESGFTSTKDMAKEIYKFIPVWFFISQRYNALSRITQVHVPVLIMHSEHDEIIPFHHGKTLFNSANEPKEFFAMKGGHNNAFYIYNDEIMQTIENFIKQHFDDKKE